MIRTVYKIIGITVIFLALCGLGVLLFFVSRFDTKKPKAEQQARIIIPRSAEYVYGDMDYYAENLAREDNMYARVELDAGEVIVSVLTGYFDGGPVEKQFIAYRNLLEAESPIYLTFIDYDETSQQYKRVFSTPTAASRPGTINLYTLDLLGDGSLCVLLSGMNGQNEHTLTVWRKNPSYTQDNNLFVNIAEIKIDGSITVREVERTQVYQGDAGGNNSFAISAFGRNSESSNMLDQVEFLFTFNEETGVYEQKSMTFIPGSQIEQQRLRQLLGNTANFEDFITGLWYNVTPQGDINNEQYIYFNPASREIIFFMDETQEVFNWVNSAATRYGLYITSQNISVTTLRRSIDIELESLNSIRVRVIEDVRLKFGVTTPWDGSYTVAGPPQNTPANTLVKAHINASYEGQTGKISFHQDGSFEMNTASPVKGGKYAFFSVKDLEMLELRPAENNSADTGFIEFNSQISQDREVYIVESESQEYPRKTITLTRARIGSGGVQRLHERAINFTLVE